MVNDVVGDTVKNVGSKGEAKSVESEGVEDKCQKEEGHGGQRSKVVGPFICGEEFGCIWYQMLLWFL